jgi:8-oxo-dGTP pyrophosphatase MutT (NUDIX family)
MDDLTKLLKDDAPHAGAEYRRPRDAATLILVDRSGSVPKVLLGRRHQRHVFMPGKFVFPGGRADMSDRYAPYATPLDPQAEAKLMVKVVRPSATKARALALAAIRETYEETGLLLGKRNGHQVALRDGLQPKNPWDAFRNAGVSPDLASVRFVARATTPPGRTRRFDTRFFTADASNIAHKVDGMVGEEAELVELVWVPIGETQHLDLPGITRRVLSELEARIAAGFGHDLPVPYFHMMNKRLSREFL